jgi:hypothetical protein
LKFEQPRIWTDLFTAVAAAEQDYVHVELILELAVRQFLDELRDDINVLKCLDYLFVIFYYSRHL